MPREVFQIETYNLSVYMGKPERYYIGLNGASKHVYVYFTDEEPQRLPYKHHDTLFVTYSHISQYAQMVDMLRNEKPVFFHFQVVNGVSYTQIKTSREATGEEEL